MLYRAELDLAVVAVCQKCCVRVYCSYGCILLLALDTGGNGDCD